MLKEEISSKSLTGDLNINIGGFNTEEATLWKNERTRNSVDDRGLIDGPHGSVDADAEGRGGGEPRDVERNIPIDSSRDSVVVDQ